MSVGKVCGYVQISVAQILEEQVLAQNTILQAFSSTGDTLWMTASDVVFYAHRKLGSLFFLLEVSDCRKVISKSIFSLRSLNLQKKLVPSLHSLGTQWCDRSVLSRRSCLHTSIYPFRLGLHVITTYQMIRWIFKYNRLSWTCWLSPWWIIFVIARFYHFCNMNKTETFAIS